MSHTPTELKQLAGHEAAQIVLDDPRNDSEALELSLIYDESAGAYFAVESPYLEQESGAVRSPYNDGEISFPEDDIGTVPAYFGVRSAD